MFVNEFPGENIGLINKLELTRDNADPIEFEKIYIGGRPSEI